MNDLKCIYCGEKDAAKESKFCSYACVEMFLAECALNAYARFINMVADVSILRNESTVTPKVDRRKDSE